MLSRSAHLCSRTLPPWLSCYIFQVNLYRRKYYHPSHVTQLRAAQFPPAGECDRAIRDASKPQRLRRSARDPNENGFPGAIYQTRNAHCSELPSTQGSDQESDSSFVAEELARSTEVLVAASLVQVILASYSFSLSCSSPSV